MPATLGHTSDRGHVATEHDAYVWETCLSLGFPLRVPTGVFNHGLKCQRSLTPTVYTVEAVASTENNVVETLRSV